MWPNIALKCVVPHCNCEAAYVNGWVTDADHAAAIARGLDVDGSLLPISRGLVQSRCVQHAIWIKSKHTHPLVEGAWLRPLLWTYKPLVIGSEQHLQLELALRGGKTFPDMPRNY